VLVSPTVKLQALLVVAALGWASLVQAQRPDKDDALPAPVREWVTATAKRVLLVPRVQEEAVRAEVRKRFAGQGALGSPEEAKLVWMVIGEAFQTADKNLQDYIAKLKTAPTKSNDVKVEQSSFPNATPGTAGKITTRTGPSSDGAISRGLGGVQMAIVKTNNPAPVSGQPGASAVQVNRAQMAELQNMTAQRNHLAELANAAAQNAKAPARLNELK